MDIIIFTSGFSLYKLEILALVTYGFLLLRFGITLINYVTKPLLPYRKACEYNDKVSILVPARNEAMNLPLLLSSIDRQTYNTYELLVLDDASTDNTAEIVSAYALTNPRCRLITGELLPDGWIGKNWACHQLSAQATGRYFLYVDADVQIGPHFISSALHEIKSKKLVLLSVFNDQIMYSAGEKLVVPLMHYILLTLLPLHLVHRTRDHRVAAASGQCMFFDAEAYRHYLFHQAHKEAVAEDIRIMRSVKNKGLKASALLANSQIRCRMYRSYSESMEGFSKNLIAGFSRSVWLCMLVVFLCTAGFIAFLFPLPVLENLSTISSTLFFYSVIFFIVAIRIMVSLLGNQPVLTNVVLHPLQMSSLVILLCTALYKHFTNSNQWKGRVVTTR
jgi:chlorobactene glucosyltransferase